MNNTVRGWLTYEIIFALCRNCFLCRAMSKAFTRESNSEEDDEDIGLPAIPAGSKNYITPQGYARMRAELLSLIDDERPKVVDIVHWAASNGDRSENGDYIYGKKRLREIDRRIRFLTKRMELASVTDPAVHFVREVPSDGRKKSAGVNISKLR